MSFLTKKIGVKSHLGNVYRIRKFSWILMLVLLGAFYMPPFSTFFAFCPFIYMTFENEFQSAGF